MTSLHIYINIIYIVYILYKYIYIIYVYVYVIYISIYMCMFQKKHISIHKQYTQHVHV